MGYSRNPVMASKDRRRGRDRRSRSPIRRRGGRGGRGDPGSNLRKPRWDTKKLESFKKDFYVPHESVQNRTKSEIEKYREEKEITLVGENIPKPIFKFDESGFPEIIIKELKKQGFIEPTAIQAQGWPIALSGNNLVGIASTGSGKTLSYIIPALIHISHQRKLSRGDGPIVLVLSPTRELAQQIQTVCDDFGDTFGVSSTCLFGGAPKGGQAADLSRGVELVIATPGRLLDFLESERTNMCRCTYLVLDEADRMLDMGFQLDIERIFNHNTMVSSAERSTLMFSATLPDSVQQIAKTYLKSDYISVAVGEVGGACKDVTQTILKVNKFGKKNALLDLLKEIDDCQGTIVFVEQKRNADFIAAFLSEMNFPTTSIHGDREQPEREKALKDFKTQKMKILVATAVAARGLDIMGVTMVINFDLPKTIEEYVHRIGRTGRLGNSGKAISFYDPENDIDMAPYLVNTLRLADQEIPEFLSQFVTVECESNQFNDIRKDVTVTSEVLEEEVW